MSSGITHGRERILVVRAGRGGDLIMITPALDALLAAEPAAEIHLLTTAEGRRILSGFSERLTRVFLYTRRFPRRLWRERQLAGELAGEGYRRIYVFETRPHYRRWLAGLAPEVHALSDHGEGHFAARCLDLVAASVAAPVARRPVRLPVDEAGRRKARDLLARHGVDPAATLVGLHPTFSGAGLPWLRDRRGNRHRLWPPDAFAELARLLAGQARSSVRPLAIVIDSLPGDTDRARMIADRSGGAVTVLSAPPDFQRYKGLLSLLDVLVTANTGPMHMAAALGTRLVALFSGWQPADCGPYTDPATYRVLQAEDTAHPSRGLAAIAPGDVAAAVWDVLGPVGHDRTGSGPADDPA
jgi:ADP-heptose:LPS heptosyltransferase